MWLSETSLMSYFVMSSKFSAKVVIVTVRFPFSVAFILSGVTVAEVEPKLLTVMPLLVADLPLTVTIISYGPVGIEGPVVHFICVDDMSSILVQATPPTVTVVVCVPTASESGNLVPVSVIS